MGHQESQDSGVVVNDQSNKGEVIQPRLTREVLSDLLEKAKIYHDECASCGSGRYSAVHQPPEKGCRHLNEHHEFIYKLNILWDLMKDGYTTSQIETARATMTEDQLRGR